MHPMPSRGRRALPKSISPCGAIRRRGPRVPSSSRSAMGQPDLFAGIEVPGMHVAGIDEAGRGPLAGPVFAAAVILDPARPIKGLDDSKKLTAVRREELSLIRRERAVAWSVGSRMEERRVGKEGVSTCSTRWAP